MNFVDHCIESLRARFGMYSRECNRDAPLQYQDGFKAGLQQAVIDIEHTLRGLSTFEGYEIPDPKEVHQRQWTIPMRWRDRSVFAEDLSTIKPQSFLRLELEKWDGESWLVRPQVWKP